MRDFYMMGTGYYFWTIIYFAGLCAHSFADDAPLNVRQIEKQVLDYILSTERYDARIRPNGVNGTDGPVVVNVNTFIRSISKIDDVNMEYSVQLTVRQKWIDGRLKYDDMQHRLKYLTLTEANRLWLPDLFFSNEKDGHFHKILTPNLLLRIFSNGQVLTSVRVSLTLFCPMYLKLYPMDEQICSMRMASYGWTTDDIIFMWDERYPLQVVRNLYVPHFTLNSFLTDYCNSKTTTGEYSCLRVDVLFKRNFWHYFIQLYIPSFVLVVISWISFWLDQKAVTARAILGIATLLSMARQISAINTLMPTVSYTTALDVWYGICLIVVLAALLEFASVNYISNLEDMNKEKTQRDREAVVSNVPPDPNETHDNAATSMRSFECESQKQERPNRLKSWLSGFTKRQSSKSHRIDIISRIAFPLAFVLFNLIYWCSYLFKEQKDNIPHREISILYQG